MSTCQQNIRKKSPAASLSAGLPLCMDSAPSCTTPEGERPLERCVCHCTQGATFIFKIRDVGALQMCNWPFIIYWRFILHTCTTARGGSLMCPVVAHQDPNSRSKPHRPHNNLRGFLGDLPWGLCGPAGLLCRIILLIIINRAANLGQCTHPRAG